jgi:hypothetical protein
MAGLDDLGITRAEIDAAMNSPEVTEGQDRTGRKGGSPARAHGAGMGW